MRIVLDTDVVVAGMRSRTGASAALLKLALDRRITLLANVPLCFEYEAKCTMPLHCQAAGFTEDEALVFVDAVVALVEPVETWYRWRPLLRDHDDEMVLEAAVNGQADALVSFNHRDYGNVPGMFNIALLTPSQALRRFRHEPG
jgi:putative PIN family toxin of toxin-antitoxin system